MKVTYTCPEVEEDSTPTRTRYLGIHDKVWIPDVLQRPLLSFTNFHAATPLRGRRSVEFSANNGPLDCEYSELGCQDRVSSCCTPDPDRSAHRERFAIVSRIPEAARDKKKLLRTGVQRFVCAALLSGVNSSRLIWPLRFSFCGVFSSWASFGYSTTFTA